MLADLQDKPKKIGGLYSLDLGQNNGPYLAKDIMLTNKNSLKLLVGNQLAKATSQLLQKKEQKQNSRKLMESEVMYDEERKEYIIFDEKTRTRCMQATDNVESTSAFQQKSLDKIHTRLEKSKGLIEKHKEDLKNLNDEIAKKNAANMTDLQPVLKEFHLRMKTTLEAERNESTKLQREIEQLNREKQQILQQILFCSKRILDLEKFVGIYEKKQIQPAEKYDSSLGVDFPIPTKD